jgi:hypothetical protein
MDPELRAQFERDLVDVYVKILYSCFELGKRFGKHTLCKLLIFHPNWFIVDDFFDVWHLRCEEMFYQESCFIHITTEMLVLQFINLYAMKRARLRLYRELE